AETAVLRPGDLSTVAEARSQRGPQASRLRLRRSEGSAGVPPATTGRRFPQDSLDGRDSRPPVRRPVHGGGGEPPAWRVFAGNRADPTTVGEQIRVASKGHCLRR
ncbi:MAG TPA: hypothetical protein PLM33_09465, partial [Acidobacteriota bacterium]|nr:hypothetical protein [Acidobacteriota bacterium]